MDSGRERMDDADMLLSIYRRASARECIMGIATRSTGELCLGLAILLRAVTERYLSLSTVCIKVVCQRLSSFCCQVRGKTALMQEDMLQVQVWDLEVLQRLHTLKATLQSGHSTHFTAAHVASGPWGRIGELIIGCTERLPGHHHLLSASCFRLLPVCFPSL